MIWLLLACRADVEADTDAEPAGIDAFAAAGPDHVLEVGQSATFDASGSAGATFRWDFGDGATSDELSPTHAWAEPGNYTAVMRATGTDGGWDSDAVRVTVHRPLPAVAPTASSMMAIDEEGTLYAVVPEAGTVAIVDGEGHAAIWDVCSAPRTVAVRAGKAAVACDDDALVLFTAATPDDAVRIALPAGSHPWGVAAGVDQWWVSLSGTGQIAEVSASGEVTLHAVGPDPRAVSVAPDGRVYAVRFRTEGDSGAVYVVGEPPIAIADVRGSDSDTSTRGVPNLLGSAAITPDGSTLWAGGTVANVYRGLARDGQALTFESTLRGVVLGIDLATGVEDDAIAKQFDNQGSSDAMVFSALGEWVWVVHPLTGTIHALDRYSGDIVGSLLGAGNAVSGLQISPDGTVLYAYAWLDRAVRAYDITDRARAELLWEASVVDAEPLAADVLRGKQVFHDAADTRLARDGYLACASCHPDGSHDGRTWDFTDRGEGLRNTASLEGRAGTAMGPLHWTANFDEIQDFENDIRHGQGGTGLLDDLTFAECEDTLGPSKAGRASDLDALAAYVATLDRAPISPYPPSAEGEALFDAKDCDVCHVPPLYTDSSLETFVRHDVGTWRPTSGGRLGGPWDGFDTPTLLGAWATAPYLHDGRSETLEEAIEAHTGWMTLTAEEIDLLAEYSRGL